MSLPLKYARVLLLALLAIATTAATTAQSTESELTAAVEQMRAGGQGNAAAQPFEAAAHAATAFVNDARVAAAPQLTVSDFQNAGFNAEDAQKIVASLSAVGSASTEIAVVAVTTATSAPAVPMATEPATLDTRTTVATVESSTPAPAATEEATLAPQQVTTQAPSTTTDTTTTQAPVLTAAPEATAVAADADSATATSATIAATAFSANTQAGESATDSSNSSSSDGVGAATLLAGGIGCVLAVGVVATVLRRKILRPETPGTPPPSRAAYFHCEKRLTPPLEMV